MMMKTRMFIAKSFAKKHYQGAMDAMKSLKSKIKKPTGMKAKAMAAGSKVKTFAKKMAGVPELRNKGQAFRKYEEAQKALMKLEEY